MTWPLLPLALTEVQWAFAGIAVTAVCTTVTAISVALINRSTGKQDKKDKTAVETVAELTTSLSDSREEVAGLRARVSSLESENRRLWKQVGKQTP